MGVIIGGAAIIGLLLRFLYPWIHTVWFPGLPEAEMQTYVLGLGLFIGLLFLYKPKKSIQAHPLTLAIAAGVLFVIQLFTLNPKHLAQMGVTVPLSPISLGIAFAGIMVSLSVKDIPKWARIIVPIAIIFLTFYVGDIAYYDATHFIGPIHNALKGVPLLSSPSWYGFLPIGFLLLIFRVVPLSLINLYVVIAVIQTIGYLLFYHFVLRLFKNNWWAILTVLVAILFNFLVQYADRNYYLQSTFIRFGIWLPVAFGFLVNNRTLRIASVTLAFFWTTDMGLYILGAYYATLLIERKYKEILQSIVAITVVFILMTLLFSPEWSNYWQFSLGYTSITMFALPIPYTLYPWLYLAIPVVVLAVTRDTLIRFLAMLSLFLFVYFTADSHLNSFHTINLPAIVILMWFIKKYANHKLLIAVAFFLPLALWGTQAMVNLKKGNILTTIQTIQKPPITEYDVVGNTKLPEKYKGNFALISPWDSYYLLVWDTTNPLGSNCLLCYWTPEAAGDLITRMKTLDTPYVFVDRDRVGYEGRVSWIFTPEVQRRYRFVETIGNLDIYEKTF